MDVWNLVCCQWISREFFEINSFAACLKCLNETDTEKDDVLEYFGCLMDSYISIGIPLNDSLRSLYWLRVYEIIILGSTI